MAFPIRTLVGSLIPAIKCDFTSGSTAAKPSDVVPLNTSNIWPVIDWAFSPVYSPSGQYFGNFYIDLGEVRTFNAVFLAHPNSGLEWASASSPILISSDATESYAAAPLSNCIAGYAYYTGLQWYAGVGRQIFLWDEPISARYLVVPFTASSYPDPLQVEEVACANLVELQYNQALSSWTRTPGTVNSQTLTMQNGRTMQIITSKATDQISASYKWSDDGTLARQLYNIFTEIASTGSPLLWVPPVPDTNQGSITNRTPEFLVLDSIPEISQTATTIWQMTINGRCQP